jgi:N-acetylmuramoyl-L-alanine amidase
MAVTATVVIDPGHGGNNNVGGSDGNHAVSPSGVKEKDMTLDLARLVQRELQSAATSGGHTINIVMTRNSDVNLSLSARANVARSNRADRFLSIHFNGFNGVSRGVETYVRRAADNVNLVADERFARKIQHEVFNVIEGFDEDCNDRGVKRERFGVLNDGALGNTPGNARCRACLLEVEFIDVPAVDRLLNTNPNAATVRQAIAAAIAKAIIDDLVNP